VDRRLASRRLADAALEHVPHDHFVDRTAIDPGAAHRLAITRAPSRGAGSGASPPRYFPMGVRTALRIRGLYDRCCS